MSGSRTSALTDRAIKSYPARAKPYKKSDGRGLFLIVRPDGAKWWRFKYKLAGKEKLLSLGVYPTVTLARARDKRDELLRALDRGEDPSAERKARKEAQAAPSTFKAVSDEWVGFGCPPQKHGRRLADRTMEKTRLLLGYLCDGIGSRSVNDIEPPELLRVLRKIESQSAENAKRCRQLASRVFRYAVRTGRATRDCAADLEGALAPVEVKHRPAIIERKPFGELLRAVWAYEGQPSTRAALQLSALLFPRPGELRLARWGEIDLHDALWNVPAERMKMRREHVVPLSRQAIEILDDLAAHTDHGADAWVFPGLRGDRPISENTLNYALRGLGYDGDTHVAHGFRSSASSMLHELGWDSAIIELQLAHADKNSVRRIYNRAERLADRRKLMQAWTDLCDAMRDASQTRSQFGVSRARGGMPTAMPTSD